MGLHGIRFTVGEASKKLNQAAEKTVKFHVNTVDSVVSKENALKF